jgi:hypothetical protein
MEIIIGIDDGRAGDFRVQPQDGADAFASQGQAAGHSQRGRQSVNSFA